MKCTVSFPNLEAMVACAAQASKEGASHTNDPRHSQGIGFDGAVKMAREGWPEGAEKVKRALDRLEVHAPSKPVSETYNDVSGAYVDVGEYVQGTPECMVDFREDTRPSRFAHIIVNASYGTNVPQEDAINRGIGIAAVIDALENQGIRCSVEATSRITNFRGSEDSLTVTVPIKETTQPLNLDILTYTLAHPAFFRRLIFGVREMQSQEVRQFFGITPGGSYGLSVDAPTIPGAILFPVLTYYNKDWSERGTVNKINAILNSIGKDGTP